MSGKSGAPGKIVNPSENPEVFAEVARMIDAASTFALFGHINPDGDSIGAVLAFHHALRAMGKTTHVFSPGAVPKFLDFLPGSGKVKARAPSNLKADLAIALDCGAEKRVGDEFLPALRRARAVLNIDHHASNEPFGVLNVVEPKASSTCEIAALFMKSRGIEITKEIASCLYAGIMYDTGRFKHPTTSPRAFSICGELVAAGASPSEIAVKIYDGRSPAHLRFIAAAISAMKVEMGGRLVWAALTREQMHEIGATPEDAEGVVDMLGITRGCEIFMVFNVQPDGRVRGSLRSKGDVDISVVASKHNGGGHRNASGFRTPEPLDTVVERVVAECRAILGEDSDDD